MTAEQRAKEARYLQKGLNELESVRPHPLYDIPHFIRPRLAPATCEERAFSRFFFLLFVIWA